MPSLFTEKRKGKRYTRRYKSFLSTETGDFNKKYSTESNSPIQSRSLVNSTHPNYISVGEGLPDVCGARGLTTRATELNAINKQISVKKKSADWDA